MRACQLLIALACPRLCPAQRDLDLLHLESQRDVGFEQFFATAEPVRPSAEDEPLPEFSFLLGKPRRCAWATTANVNLVRRNDRQCGGADASALAQGTDAFIPGCDGIVVGRGHFERLCGRVLCAVKPRPDAPFCQTFRIYFRASFSELRGRRGPCAVTANRWKPAAPPAETRRSSVIPAPRFGNGCRRDSAEVIVMTTALRMASYKG